MEKKIIDQQDIVSLKEELEIIRLSKKDPYHFRSLYEKYYKMIFLFIFHKNGNKDVTADIVSQVFVKALANLSKYEDRGLPFSAWLYRIASNELMQYFRSTTRERLVSIDDAMLENICEEAKGPDIEELKMNLEKIIGTLDHTEVQILEWKYYEGKSYKEIAFILELTETNVKTRSWRILEKIRKQINIENE